MRYRYIYMLCSLMYSQRIFLNELIHVTFVFVFILLLNC